MNSLVLSNGKNKVTASCLASDAVGNFVQVVGNKTGNDYSVSKTDLTVKKPSIGVIVSKLSTNRCVVQVRGPVKGIFSGLIPGKMMWVGSDGLPTNLYPAPPSGTFYYNHTIGVSISDDEIELDPPDMLHGQV